MKMQKRLTSIVLILSVVTGVSDASPINPAEWEVDANTVALFHFNDESAENAVPGGKPGKIVADTAWTVSGRFGAGLTAAADDMGYFQADLPPDAFPSGAFTLEAWIRPHSIATNSSYVIGFTGGGSGSFLRLSGDGTAMFVVWVADGTNYPEWKDTGRIDLGVNVLDGDWHHVAGTFDGQGTMKIFVNGEEKASATHAGYVLFGTPTTLNAAGGVSSKPDSDTNQFIGDIDEIRVSDIAREDFSGATKPEQPR